MGCFALRKQVNIIYIIIILTSIFQIGMNVITEMVDVLIIVTINGKKMSTALVGTKGRDIKNTAQDVTELHVTTEKDELNASKIVLTIIQASTVAVGKDTP